MKVIKPEVDLETWSQEETCPHCTSIVAIENEDVHYEYESRGFCYWAECCLCNHRIRFKEEDLPKIVRAAAWKYRRIIHYSND